MQETKESNPECQYMPSKNLCIRTHAGACGPVPKLIFFETDKEKDAMKLGPAAQQHGHPHLIRLDKFRRLSVLKTIRKLPVLANRFEVKGDYHEKR